MLALDEAERGLDEAAHGVVLRAEGPVDDELRVAAVVRGLADDDGAVADEGPGLEDGLDALGRELLLKRGEDDVPRAEPELRRRGPGAVGVRGLEGLCDGRSLKALLSRVAPRGVLVCPAVASGKDGAAEKLAKFARDRLFPERAEALVAAPRPGETVDLGPWLGRAPLADAELSWRIVHAHQGAATSLGDGFDVSRVFSAVLDDDGTGELPSGLDVSRLRLSPGLMTVSYTHLRAHATDS